MNNRIKELAAQAYGLCRTIDDEGQYVVLTDQWNEKFGELIVKECVDRLRLEGELGKIQAIAGPSGMYKLAFMNEAANIINEHFGVN